MSNKLIETSNEPQVLKIVHGNDFSLHIYVTQWNAETESWDYYDLSATRNLDFYLVSTNFKRIKLDYVMQSDGSLIVDVLSNYLQTTTYGVEMTWLSSTKNRRTYTPLMLQIVKSTPEADTDIEEYQNSVYDLNIRITNDINMIRIGGVSNIPDEDIATKQYIDYYCYSKDYIDDYYYDKGDVDNMLTSYINETDLQSALDAFDAEIASEYIDHSELDDALSYYTTTDDLNENFATKSYVDEKIAAIPETDLTDYVTYSYLDSKNLASEAYVTNAINAIPATDLSDYPTYAYINSKGYMTESRLNDLGYLRQSDISAMSYATQNYVEQSINAIDIPDVSNFVSNSTLESVLQSYITEGELNTRLNTASYATTGDLTNTYNDLKSYVNTQIAAIDYSAYVTHTELNNAAYLQSSDLNDYATKSYVDGKVSGLASETYVTNAVNAIDLSDFPTYAYIESQDFASETYVTNAVNAIDLSDFPTYAYIESQDFASETYVTNAVNAIDLSSYVTTDELDAMGYITVDDIPEIPDLSGCVTHEQLSAMSYVDQTSLSAMGYITAQDVPSQDMSAYVTHTELNNAGYITINDVPTPDLSSYVTHTELSNCGYITINDVPTVDTSAYVTHTELNNASYTTESYVSSNYAKKTDVPVNGIKFVNDSPIAVSYLWAGTNAELAQVSPRDNNTLYITTDDATTYVDLTPYALKSETAKVVTLTQDQYNALIATGPVDEYTIYLIIEQQ